MSIRSFAYIACGFLTTVIAVSCDSTTPTGENLLTNSSFEDAGDGIPAGWEIKNFRGLADMKEATWGVDAENVQDGNLSFYFRAEKDTRRFFTLTQEIEVKGVKSLRIHGWVKTVGVDIEQDQYPQAGIGVTYYTESRERFDSARWADARTEPLYGSTDGWTYLDVQWPLPKGTALVEVHCILGMSGQIWFDQLIVEVPEGLPWHEHQGEFFTHYWLDESPYPEGVYEFQENLYAFYADRLGMEPEKIPKVSYYYYPSPQFLKDALGLHMEVPEKVDYERLEIHSSHPAEKHEIIHLLTNTFGKLPRNLGEGTAYYLMDNYKGKSIQPQAQELLLSKKMPPLKDIIGPFTSNVPPDYLIPTAASFVGYLIEFGGTKRFHRLHQFTSSDMSYESFSQAFANAYGPLDEAENAWLSTLATADFSKYKEEHNQKGDSNDDG